MLTEKERNKKCLAMWKKLSESGLDDKNSALRKKDKQKITFNCYLCEYGKQKWEKETGIDWRWNDDADLKDICSYCPLKNGDKHKSFVWRADRMRSLNMLYCLDRTRFSYNLWEKESLEWDADPELLKKYAQKFYNELKEVLGPVD